MTTKNRHKTKAQADATQAQFDATQAQFDATQAQFDAKGPSRSGSRVSEENSEPVVVNEGARKPGRSDSGAHRALRKAQGLRLTIQAGLIAGAGALTASSITWLAAPGGPALRTIALLIGILFAIAAVAFVVHFSVVRRLQTVLNFLSADNKLGQPKLPDFGSDPVGRVASEINGLVSDLTVLRADIIDQKRVLRKTQDELKLQMDLASKTAELQQRLGERELLYDVLRISASHTELSEILEVLADRLGKALGIRELAILLREEVSGEEYFVIRAVHGFRGDHGLLGRQVAIGEGVAGAVAIARKPVYVSDVASDDEYLAFWGHAPKDGSFAAVPCVYEHDVVGVLAITRSDKGEFSAHDELFLRAIARATALAIHQATLVSELQRRSVHDELTGVGNRRLLNDELRREHDRVKRFGVPLSLLAIDVDHFKALNDRLGHPTGDAVLRKLGQVFRDATRRTDTIARTGGEEFIILLPDSDGQAAIGVARKLQNLVRDTDFPGGATQPGGKLSVSIGVASLDGELQTTSAMLKASDKALYFAKESGRDRIAIFDGGPSVVPDALESEIRAIRPSPELADEDVGQCSDQ